jgi:hypothetical protein
MFVRFRKTPTRLQLSILETRRAAGKVAIEHVASLGSVAVPLSVGGRQAFWANLWDRLAGLGNRIGPDDQAKIRNAVHARIPMVLPDEANADEASFWAGASAFFDGAERRARAAREYQEALEEAELLESVAASFAECRAAALKGEWPDRGVAHRLVAAKVGFQPPMPDGTPCIMANGEAGIVRNVKRPNRHDRRRRRGGFRFTPAKAAEGDDIDTLVCRQHGVLPEAAE